MAQFSGGAVGSVLKEWWSFVRFSGIYTTYTKKEDL